MAESLAASAGANSIFVGEKLLTTPNPRRDEDDRLLRDRGLLGSAHGQSPSQKNG
jgi:biotin synthase